MAKKTAEDLDALLGPLLETVTSRGCRLVACPGSVYVDRAGGSTRVEIDWGEADHQRAVRAVPCSPVRLSNGTTACAVAETLVLQSAPDPLRRPDDLVAEGWLSPLASRVLSQTVALGRNILLVGPRLACAELAAALLAEGTRPAMIGEGAQAAPPGWLQVTDIAAARNCGADRIGACALDGAALTQVMSELCGVIGWIDARRLDRGLVRFELAGDRGAGGGPLRVLAGIDLVVVLGVSPGPRVREVAEIVMHDDGYRPLTLFTTGRPPVASALVPVAAPTFLGELERAGQGVLADELRHAVGVAIGPARGPGFVAAASEIVTAPIDVAAPEISHAPHVAGPFVAMRPPPPHPSLDDAPPPGWELDQLGDAAIAAEAAAISDPDAALMAASYGLGPPPRPASVPGGAGGPYDGTFADALEHARQRDAELRAELLQAEQAEDLPDSADVSEGWNEPQEES